LLVGIILILVLAVFLLSNRESVPVGYWPFGLVLGVPLGGITLGALAVGFLLGLVFHLPRRLAVGARARRAERRVQELEARQVPPPLA
jgi:uncharacterized integral membrane protein